MGLVEGAAHPVRGQSPLPLGLHGALFPLAHERSHMSHMVYIREREREIHIVDRGLSQTGRDILSVSTLHLTEQTTQDIPACF